MGFNCFRNVIEFAMSAQCSLDLLHVYIKNFFLTKIIKESL